MRPSEAPAASDSPSVPVSWGELIDKITILEIKRARIERPEARANVARELALLQEIGGAMLSRAEIAPLHGQLTEVNAALWEIEDAIRGCEAAASFGPAFIALARAVYTRNDERAAIKREINLRLGSALIEEKSYSPTGPCATAS